MREVVFVAVCSFALGLVVYDLYKSVMTFCRGLSRKKAVRKLSASIDEIIKSIYGLSYEVTYVLDESGEIIYNVTQYNPKACTFSEEQIAYLQNHPGTISVHNHDTDTPPSLQDLNFAAVCKSRIILVVSPNYLYTVMPNESGWKDLETVNAAASKYYDLLKSTPVKKKFVGVDRDGAWVYEELTELETTDESIEAITKELGYFYERRDLERSRLTPSA